MGQLNKTKVNQSSVYYLCIMRVRFLCIDCVVSHVPSLVFILLLLLMAAVRTLKLGLACPPRLILHYVI